MDGRKRPRDRGSESKLSQLRLAAGLTQQQLADLVGVDLRTERRWENGTTPSGRSLVSLSAALGCRIEELLGGDGV